MPIAIANFGANGGKVSALVDVFQATVWRYETSSLIRLIDRVGYPALALAQWMAGPINASYVGFGYAAPAKVRFHVLRDGTIRGVELTQSSGDSSG